VLPYFEETVEELLKKYDAKEALSRALALTTGYTNMIKQRSLLFSAEGYITFMIEASHEIRSPGYFWNVLKRYFAPEITDSIKGMSMLQSKTGVVFDLPDQHKNIFLDMQVDFEKEGFKVSQPVELPEIQERFEGGGRYSNGRSNGQGNGYGRGRYGNRDSSRGYGNRDNGRGYGNRDSGSRSYGNRDRNGGGREDRRKNYKKLFVANLPFNIAEQDLDSLLREKKF
jgi:hypothetical protein